MFYPWAKWAKVPSIEHCRSLLFIIWYIFRYLLTIGFSKQQSFRIEKIDFLLPLSAQAYPNPIQFFEIDNTLEIWVILGCFILKQIANPNSILNSCPTNLPIWKQFVSVEKIREKIEALLEWNLRFYLFTVLVRSCSSWAESYNLIRTSWMKKRRRLNL